MAPVILSIALSNIVTESIMNTGSAPSWALAIPGEKLDTISKNFKSLSRFIGDTKYDCADAATALAHKILSSNPSAVVMLVAGTSLPDTGSIKGATPHATSVNPAIDSKIYTYKLYTSVSEPPSIGAIKMSLPHGLTIDSALIMTTSDSKLYSLPENEVSSINSSIKYASFDADGGKKVTIGPLSNYDKKLPTFNKHKAILLGYSIIPNQVNASLNAALGVVASTTPSPAPTTPAPYFIYSNSSPITYVGAGQTIYESSLFRAGTWSFTLDTDVTSTIGASYQKNIQLFNLTTSTVIGSISGVGDNQCQGEITSPVPFQIIANVVLDTTNTTESPGTIQFVLNSMTITANPSG